MLWMALLVVLGVAFVATLIGVVVAIIGGVTIRNKAKKQQGQRRWDYRW